MQSPPGLHHLPITSHRADGPAHRVKHEGGGKKVAKDMFAILRPAVQQAEVAPRDVLQRPYTVGGPPPPSPRLPSLLPFQCWRLTAKMLRRLRCQEDLSVKNFGPLLARTIGGPSEEGGPSHPPPPSNTCLPSSCSILVPSEFVPQAPHTKILIPRRQRQFFKPICGQTVDNVLWRLRRRIHDNELREYPERFRRVTTIGVLRPKALA